jgi:hypothetical protein
LEDFMRWVLLGAAALACVSGAAVADDAADPMAAAYGNTMVFVDKGGMESHTYYNADHSFTGVVPSMSYKYAGTWEIKDGKLCRTFNPEVPGRANPDCDPDAQAVHAVGDSWDAPDGGKVSLTAGQN